MIQGASPELIQQLLYRIEIQAYLTYAVCFGFCPHLNCLVREGHTGYWVIGRSELIKNRTGVKTNCLKLVIFRNDPLTIHWRIA